MWLALGDRNYRWISSPSLFPYFLFGQSISLLHPPVEHIACRGSTCRWQMRADDKPNQSSTGMWGRGYSVNPTHNPDSPQLEGTASHLHTEHRSQIQGQNTLSSNELTQFKTTIHAYMAFKFRRKEKQAISKPSHTELSTTSSSMSSGPSNM